jgi:hypothetical protein
MLYFLITAGSAWFIVWNVQALADSPKCLLYLALAVVSGVVLSTALVSWACSALSSPVRRGWPDAGQSAGGRASPPRRRQYPTYSPAGW